MGLDSANSTLEFLSVDSTGILNVKDSNYLLQLPLKMQLHLKRSLHAGRYDSSARTSSGDIGALAVDANGHLQVDVQ